jgi:hypothetical protein
MNVKTGHGKIKKRKPFFSRYSTQTNPQSMFYLHEGLALVGGLAAHPQLLGRAGGVAAHLVLRVGALGGVAQHDDELGPGTGHLHARDHHVAGRE